jgi:ABC-2 type transport system permease protein
MRATLSLFRREFSSYWVSPIAYVVLVVFLVVTGWLFYLTLGLLTTEGPEGIRFPMQRILGDVNFWLVFLFIPPLLTMRLFAEERSTGTLEVLMTAPVTDWQVVLCKYLAAFAFYLVMWLPTLVYLPVLLDIDWGTFEAGIDPGPVLASYLGVVLAGAMFLALGLFVSNLVRSQMVAALISLALGLVFILVGIWRPDMDTGSLGYRVLYFITVPLHFQRGFTRGIVDSRNVILYISLTVLFLFLTVRNLESRRWR